MAKAEEIDLFVLLNSLTRIESKKIISLITSKKLKGQAVYLRILKELQKRPFYDKQKLLVSLNITSKQLNIFKFKLFKLILEYKVHDKRSDRRQGPYELNEFEVLLNASLYLKALRKLKKVKAIVDETCEFEYFLIAQRQAIESSLFSLINQNHDSIRLAYQELREYQDKFTNLNEYRNLSDLVFVLHYKVLDKRAPLRKQMLEYIDHPLLEDEQKAVSIMAKFYYYRILSIIHLGDNNYEKSRRFSLKAYNYLIQNRSKIRNDYSFLIKSLNNYLDASLHLKDLVEIDKYFPQFEQLILPNVSDLNYPQNAISLQYLISFRVNYLWVKKDFDQFFLEFDYFLSMYTKHERLFQPNTKAEILLGFARILFHSTKYEEAEKYCEQLLLYEKNNPTHLIICQASILRVMINYELGNFRIIPFTINSSRYVIKSRNRYFEIEKLILTRMTKIKSYNTEKANTKILKNIRKTLGPQLIIDENRFIEGIGLIEWLDSKI